MKALLCFMLAGCFVCPAFAQTVPVTVDANDVLNSNNKLIIKTSGGQSFFTGHQLGGGYAYPDGIFRAITDNPTSNNVFFDGLKYDSPTSSYLLTYSVYSDGTGFFARGIGIGTNNIGGYGLQVQKTSQLQPAIMIGGAFANGPRLQVYGLDADPQAYMGLGTDMGGGPYEHSVYFPTGPSWAPGKLTLGDYNGSQYNTRMTLLQNGNLGIGAPMPNVKLQVNSNNSGTGYNDWITANFGAASGDRLVVGLLDGTATIGAHNNTLTAWSDISINPFGGKVGIGTKTPSSALDVGGYIQISSTDAASPPADLSYGLFPYSGIGLGIFSGAVGSNQGIGFWTNGGNQKKESLRINANGNVGVGTTAPQTNLEVSNGSYSNGNQLMVSGAEHDRYNGIISETVSAGQTTFSLGTTSNYSSFAQTLNLYNGNVGIGETNPRVPLHVNGNIAAAAAVDPTNTYLQFERSGDQYIGARVGNAYSMSGYRGNLVFETNNGGGPQALSEGMRLTSDGNLVVGATDPQGYKLAINGNAIANSMTVKLYPWHDYVFEKSYALMPLKELADYVHKNHHLPEIPSAAQVEKDGLNLGEINGLLVKKVEELTLYLIEKEKEIRELKASQEERLKKLEQRLELLEKQ